MKYVFLFVLVIGLAACDQKGTTDAAKERATAEGEAERDVQAKALAEKAMKMEVDLSNKHYFYSAVEGEYEGTLKVGADTYKIKFTLVRSLPPFTGNRVRELSEIENDLNNLYFHMQVVQWHPSDEASAVGCRIGGIRPNLDEGTLSAAASDCPNLYSLFISEGGAQALTDKAAKAKNLAKQITSKQVSEVSYLVGTVQPSSVAMKYSFNVKRVP